MAGLTSGCLQLTRGQLEGAGLGAEGTHSLAENRLPCKQHPETSKEWGEKGDERRARRRSGRRGGVSEQSPPPHFLPGGIEPEGAALGRGQRFFVSPALLAWHRGGAPILAEGLAVLLKT